MPRRLSFIFSAIGSVVRYAMVLVFGWAALALAEIPLDGALAIDTESTPAGQGALGSKSPPTAGLKTYRRSQTATLGGRSVAKNASLPVLSISQNGILGSPAWLARFCVVIRKGNACSGTFSWPPLKASSTRP